MRTITACVSICAIAFLFAGPASADPVADARAHSEAFARAVNAKDASAVLALYTNDAHVIWPGQGEEAKGKTEIAKLVANMITGLTTQNGVIVFKSQEAIPLDDDHIATIGQWEQTVTGPDGKRQTVAVRTTEIIKKQGGQTLYVVDHASVGVPPPPSPPSSAAAKP